VAGWFVLPRRWPIEAHNATTTVDFLNAMKAQGYVMKRYGWYDIGTPETYMAYWKGENE